MADSSAAFASFSLTHVHYDPTDTLSYLCAWLALTPQMLCIVYTTLIYSTREVEIVLAFAGQLACECLNWVLKRIIKQERPKEILHLGKGYGMPSSHAQFVAFFSVNLTLFLLLRHVPVGLNAQKLHLHHPRLTHAVLSVSGLMGAVAVTISRVYLKYHTTGQVWVGFGAGAACALAWFAVTETARRIGLIEWVLDLGLVRLMRIRDLICEEDLIELGWRESEARRLRGKKRRTETANGHVKKRR